MKKAQNCDNSVVCHITTFNQGISKVMSKYSINSSFLSVSCTVLKEQVRKHFVDTSVVNGKLSVF